MEKRSLSNNPPEPNKNGLIVVGGAGGFIAGALARYFQEQGFTRIRAIDKKPLPEWYQRVPGVESLCLDLSDQESCIRACEGAWEVYNLAADMGGMGFIERFRIECLRSVLINTHLIEAANRAGAERYFYSSSACAYNTDLQKDPKGVAQMPGPMTWWCQARMAVSPAASSLWWCCCRPASPCNRRASGLRLEATRPSASRPREPRRLIISGIWAARRSGPDQRDPAVERGWLRQCGLLQRGGDQPLRLCDQRGGRRGCGPAARHYDAAREPDESVREHGFFFGGGLRHRSF